MKQIFVIFLTVGFLSCSGPKNTSKGWVSLFDGKSFAGWKASETPSSFKIESGMIIVNGDRGHLFYEGDIAGHNFKNFELSAEVMTEQGSNSGIFIHTAYQETGWPSKGYEVQVNNSHTDWRRTGSLYSVNDVKELYVKDKEWFTEYIKVEGKKVTVKINDKVVMEYTEPDSIEKEKGREEKHLSAGTFALQAHDPKSKVYFKNIKVNVLPE
jgi:hypothetical protein